MSQSRKVLVTGGAGYIGSHTVVSLMHSGFEPVILDNLSNSEPSVIDNLKEILQKEIVFYKGDCCDQALVDRIFREHKLQGVIHFAASKAVGESVEKPLLYYSNNLDSLMIILEQMLINGVRDLVFSSSCTVYGQPDKLPVTENTQRKPAASPYGNTKKIGEDIILDVVNSPSALRGISLRYFNPVGAHESGKLGELPVGVPSNLVPFVAQTAAGIRETITIFGDDYDTPDGTCIRDYIHVMDLADAHVKAFEYLEKQQTDSFYDVFNIGTGNGNTVLEVINTFQEVTSTPVNYRIGERRNGDVEQIFANADKAERVMGWKANKTLDDSLRDTWRWQQTLMKSV